jgi:hypothetical protein
VEQTRAMPSRFQAAGWRHSTSCQARGSGPGPCVPRKTGAVLCLPRLWHPFPIAVDHLPFTFGRSTRSSRNSSGPLIRRRFRLAFSSSGAWTVNLSIAFEAKSFARAARATGACFGLVLTVSPTSTRRFREIVAPLDVSVGSNSEVGRPCREVRFTLKNGSDQPSPSGPKSAMSRQRNAGPSYVVPWARAKKRRSIGRSV